jgi:hypothetical protein
MWRQLRRDVRSQSNRYKKRSDSHARAVLPTALIDGARTKSPLQPEKGALEVSYIESAPEASTSAMMLLGFAGLGALGYRQSANTKAATA